jgi:hypothetical protein
MTQDPRRLRDDPTAPEVAQALRGAQGDVLSPDAVARVRAGLAAAGVVGAGMGALAAAPRSPAAKLLGVALRVGLAGLGLAGVVGIASMRHAPGAAEAPSTTGEATPASIPPAPAPPPVGAPAPPAIDTPAAAAPAEASATRTHASARPPAAAAPSLREGALLLEARRALEIDPARALSLVRAHETEFPRSQLAPERARIAAEARQRLAK